MRFWGVSSGHRLTCLQHVSRSLEKKDDGNLMLWPQFLVLSATQRVGNERMRMELRWDNKYQARTPLSFSSVIPRGSLRAGADPC